MKKTIFFFVILVSLTVFLLSCASAENNALYPRNYLPEAYKNDLEIIPEFSLPASVTAIEDEAFEGTAIVKVTLPTTVVSIGERAFANIHSLRIISIPKDTEKIAQSAFAGSNRVSIAAAPNSFAHKWAGKNGIPFSPIVSICASIENSTIQTTVRSSKEVIEPYFSYTYKSDNQWRKKEETTITQKHEIFKNNIQGRAPPMG